MPYQPNIVSKTIGNSALAYLQLEGISIAPNGVEAAVLGSEGANVFTLRNGTETQNLRVGPASSYLILQKANSSSGYVGVVDNVSLDFGQNNTTQWRIDTSGNFVGITATGGAGYAAGAGGTVTQATNRTTGVTINKVCGAITTNTASLAAEAAAEFTVTNSAVAATDTVVASIKSGSDGGNTAVIVSAVAAGSFNLKVCNNNAAAGTAETGAIVINFAVIKAATS